MNEPVLSAEEAVTAPLGTADLATELERAGRGPSKLTVILSAAVVLAVTFGAGAWTHSVLSPSTTSVSPGRSVPGQLPGGPGGGGVRIGPGGAVR